MLVGAWVEHCCGGSQEKGNVPYVGSCRSSPSFIHHTCSIRKWDRAACARSSLYIIRYTSYACGTVPLLLTILHTSYFMLYTLYFIRYTSYACGIVPLVLAILHTSYFMLYTLYFILYTLYFIRMWDRAARTCHPS